MSKKNYTGIQNKSAPVPILRPLPQELTDEIIRLQ